MTNSTIDFKKLISVTEAEDTVKEEYIYKVGSDGHMPIVLLATLATGYDGGLERYLNLVVHTEEAKKLAVQFKKENAKVTLEKIASNFVEQVNALKNIHVGSSFDDFLKDEGIYDRVTEKTLKKIAQEEESQSMTDEDWKKLEEIPVDAILIFGLYCSQLATFLAMKTAHYNFGYEGVPQVCSRIYLNYLSQPEFKNVYEHIDIAFNHVVSEIIKVLKLKGFNINKENMTIEIPDYKALTFTKEMYPFF